MKNFIMDKKTTTRVEDLVPSNWFKQKLADWDKAVRLWNSRLSEYKTACAEKQAAKRKKEAAAVAKARADEAAKVKAAADGKEGENSDEAKKAEEKGETKPMEVEEETTDDVSVDFAGLDVFEV